jgi:hypothetical protein
MHPLQLSGADLRALGAQAMEIVVRHFESGRDDPVSTELRRRDTEALLRTPLPEAGMPAPQLLACIIHEGLDSIVHGA